MTWLEVSSSAKKIVLETYGTTEETLENDAKSLQVWINTQPHLPETMDLGKIKFFLLDNECSVEIAKHKIDNYYTVYSKIPDIFPSNPDFFKRDVSDYLYFMPLPKLTADFHRVWVLKARKPELVEEVDPVNLVSQLCKIYEVGLGLGNDFTLGDIHFYDLTGHTFKYVMKWTPSILKKIVDLYTKMFSIRTKAVYFCNCPGYVTPVLEIVQAILKGQVFSNVHLMSNPNEILEVFPKEIIPKDLGGEEKSLDEINDALRQNLKENEGRFDKLASMKVNENLRPQKLKNDEVLGFYGNFKKLNVD